MLSIVSLLNQLQQKGVRATVISRRLLEVLADNDTPLTAEELLEKIRRRHPSANKTTVYRQLNTLLEHGILLSTHLNDRAIRYELNETKAAHHHHLVCTVCGGIENISLPENTEYETVIRRRTKFKVERHTLEFFGKCAGCQKITE